MAREARRTPRIQWLGRAWRSRARFQDGGVDGRKRRRDGESREAASAHPRDVVDAESAYRFATPRPRTSGWMHAVVDGGGGVVREGVRAGGSTSPNSLNGWPRWLRLHPPPTGRVRRPQPPLWAAAYSGRRAAAREGRLARTARFGSRTGISTLTTGGSGAGRRRAASGVGGAHRRPRRPGDGRPLHRPHSRARTCAAWRAWPEDGWPCHRLGQGGCGDRTTAGLPGAIRGLDPLSRGRALDDAGVGRGRDGCSGSAARW